MSIPRGFALLFADLAAEGWDWHAMSTRNADDPPVITTVLVARAPDLTLVAVWRDGSWGAGLARHPNDPVPVPIGARMLRPILTGTVLEDELAGPIVWNTAPRWVRPDLDAPREGSKNPTPRGDEGTPAAQRWAPDIEARVQAGMDRLAHYGRTKEWT